LQLKKPDDESGIADSTGQWVLARITKKYSDLIEHPVIFKNTREEIEYDSNGAPRKDSQKALVIEDKTLNLMKPIGSRRPEEPRSSRKRSTRSSTNTCRAIGPNH
jgi:HSP90 family molecular chaperone